MLCTHASKVAGAGFLALACCTTPALAQSVGASSSFAVAGAAGVTAAGGAGTVITGDVGTSPSASITGFPPGVVVPPFGLHANDASAIAAQGANVALFTALSAGACTDTVLPQMSAASFGPGIHCFTSTADLANLSNMTLTGAGVYIFRVPTALTANVGSTVTLAGVDPCSVFWQVGSAATINGVNFAGTIVAQAGVTLGTGARLAGRAFAVAGPVTMAGSNVVGGCSTTAVPPAACPTIVLSPTTLPEGRVAVAYSQAITGSGGTAPYTYAVRSGALPAGLTLATTGALAGTPSAAGPASFLIRGADVNGCFAELPYALTIAAAVAPPAECPVLVINPATLPTGTVGVPYALAVSVTGGTAPYSFGITAGALPGGLVLSPLGALSGSPTTAATAAFTLRATDAAGCFIERPYSIVTLAPVPTLTQWATLTLTVLLGLIGVRMVRARQA